MSGKSLLDHQEDPGLLNELTNRAFIILGAGSTELVLTRTLTQGEIASLWALSFFVYSGWVLMV